jgi:hypothetical protein
MPCLLRLFSKGFLSSYGNILKCLLTSHGYESNSKLHGQVVSYIAILFYSPKIINIDF